MSYGSDNLETCEEALDLCCDMEIKSDSLTYESEWKFLSMENLELIKLKEKAINGGLRTSRLRSIAWKLLLGALTPGISSQWVKETQISRDHYRNLKKYTEVDVSPSSQSEKDNPLSQDNESIWNQYFCNRELKTVIKQDVIRTFPGIEFFKQESIQEAMINILFYYARENPIMCYRQGMHEVLAPIIFIVHNDHEAMLNETVSPEIAFLLDSNCLEEDSYTIFLRIMNAIGGSYLIANIAPTSTGYLPSRNDSPANENQVITQLKWIRDSLLAPNDPELHHHLVALEIHLPLFGIRWLRLLFGREFVLPDLLVLWEAIFAENTSFDLSNYIAVAMLIMIRNPLLSSDYTGCLTMLMQYPAPTDISCIIKYALHLKNPVRYKMPLKMIFPAKDNQIDITTKITKSSKKGNEQEKDPVILSRKLNHAYNVMSVCQIKLTKYHYALQRSVAVNDEWAQDALTGIRELSKLLGDSIKHPRLPVDIAYEAQEKAVKSAPVKQKPMPRPPSTVDMKVFSQTSFPVKENTDETNRMWRL